MTAQAEIRPLDPNRGVGFWSYTPQPVLGHGYRYEQVGRYHNYYATVKAWRWPVAYEKPHGLKIDAFSPNLNKMLHVGHLRNLAIARSLYKLLGNSANTFVALYGASLGVKKAALEGIKTWYHFLGYQPKEYYDVLMPEDMIQIRQVTEADIELWKQRANLPMSDNEVESRMPNFSIENNTTQVWDGPNGPVIVKRSDGKKLYSYHDLVFATEVSPTHYITGYEQCLHFNALGLGDKHLPMGLVLGVDGKKMKSRDGTGLLAEDAMEMVKANLDETKFPTEVAWNVLAWNFLHVSRTEDLKFEAEKWTRAESPGMYITYTYARIKKALRECEDLSDEMLSAQPIEPVDFELRALADQCRYWENQAVSKFDPASLANFTHELARKLNSVYQSETNRIVGGSLAFICAVEYAVEALGTCMCNLGMFPLCEV